MWEVTGEHLLTTDNRLVVVGHKLLSVATEITEGVVRGLETPVSRWESEKRKAASGISVIELVFRSLMLVRIMLGVHGCLGFAVKEKSIPQCQKMVS